MFITTEAAGGLGHMYLGDRHDRPAISNVEESYLRMYLVNKYSPALIDKAIFEFTKAISDN